MFLKQIFLIALIGCGLLSAVSGNAHQSHRCPSGPEWYYYKGWCYSLSSDTEGWFGSEKVCRRLGGHLAHIIDNAENEFAQALGECQKNFWIGMVKTDVRNRRFSWWNDHPANYSSPLLVSAAEYHDCVYLRGNSDGRWVNTPCQALLPMLCKVPAREILSESDGITALQQEDEVKTERKCPEGWLSLEGKCFYISSVKANYFNAQINCESMGATLASLNSRREQKLLTIALGCSSRFWIGLEKVRPCAHDPSKASCWMWMDGTPLVASNWANGHPSPLAEVECTTTGGQWYTSVCHSDNFYVCMKK